MVSIGIVQASDSRKFANDGMAESRSRCMHGMAVTTHLRQGSGGRASGASDFMHGYSLQAQFAWVI